MLAPKETKGGAAWTVRPMAAGKKRRVRKGRKANSRRRRANRK